MRAYRKYRTEKVELSYKPSRHLNFINIADSMVKVYIDTHDKD